jgi:hypothetical protein
MTVRVTRNTIEPIKKFCKQFSIENKKKEGNKNIAVKIELLSFRSLELYYVLSSEKRPTLEYVAFFLYNIQSIFFSY